MHTLLLIMIYILVFAAIGLGLIGLIIVIGFTLEFFAFIARKLGFYEKLG